MQINQGTQHKAHSQKILFSQRTILCHATPATGCTPATKTQMVPGNITKKICFLIERYDHDNSHDSSVSYVTEPGRKLHNRGSLTSFLRGPYHITLS